MWIKLLPYGAAALVAAIVTGWFAYQLHGWDVDRIKAAHKIEMAEQKAQLLEQCANEKRTTREVSNDYQRKNSALERELTDTKLLYASAPCTTVSIAGPAAGRDAAGNGPVHEASARDARIATGALVDFAGACERSWNKLTSCQQFIDRVWKLNGH